MPDPFSWTGAIGAKYGPTAAGLLIGMLAKYGLTLSEGGRVTWRGLLADLLLQGLLGLIAIAIGDVLGLSGNARVFVGALAALNSDRLVRLARDRFFEKVDQDLVTAIRRTDALAEVAAGPADAASASARLTSFRGSDPRTAGIEKLAEGRLPKNGREFDELLGKLDDID